MKSNVDLLKKFILFQFLCLCFAKITKSLNKASFECKSLLVISLYSLWCCMSAVAVIITAVTAQKAICHSYFEILNAYLLYLF
jgi:hypothetical protein